MVLHIIELNASKINGFIDDPANLRVLCQGCCRVRRESGDQMEAFLKLVVAHGPFKLDKDGSFFAKPRVPYTLFAERDERHLWSWAAAKHHSRPRYDQRKRGDGDVVDDCKIAKQTYVGEGPGGVGLLMDPCGLVMDIKFFEIDCKNSHGRYDPPNMRPHVRALNILRNDFTNDTPTTGSLNGVRTSHETSATP